MNKQMQTIKMSKHICHGKFVFCGLSTSVILFLLFYHSFLPRSHPNQDHSKITTSISFPPNTWERAVARDSQIQAVAKHILDLQQTISIPSPSSNASRAEYFRYLDWQDKPLPAALQWRLENSVVNLKCRVCERIHADRDRTDLGPILVHSTARWVGQGIFQCRMPLGVLCQWTFDEKARLRADVLATIDPTPPKLWHPHQRLLFISGEPPFGYGFNYIEQLPRVFNWTATYSITSDFQLSFAAGDIRLLARASRIRVPDSNRLTQYYDASSFITNCNDRNGRNEIVLKLQKYGVRVAAFGKCGRTIDDGMADRLLPDCVKHRGNPWDWKACVLPYFRFHLAFENSNVQDYVTEKLFMAFHANTVPIYWGAPNVDEFLPDPHSIINLDRF